MSDEEWGFVVPYLTLNRLDSEHQHHDAYRVQRIAMAGAKWCIMAHDAARVSAVASGASAEATLAASRLVRGHSPRSAGIAAQGRRAQSSATILDSRTVQSTPESGARAGYDGAKRHNGATVHAAIDTLGYLLALHVTPADEQDRAQVERLAKAV